MLPRKDVTYLLYACRWLSFLPCSLIWAITMRELCSDLGPFGDWASLTLTLSSYIILFWKWKVFITFWYRVRSDTEAVWDILGHGSRGVKSGWHFLTNLQTLSLEKLVVDISSQAQTAPRRCIISVWILVEQTGFVGSPLPPRCQCDTSYAGAPVKEPVHWQFTVFCNQ